GEKSVEREYGAKLLKGGREIAPDDEKVGAVFAAKPFPQSGKCASHRIQETVGLTRRSCIANA
ncbi:MAG: hypothetical protein ACOCZ9_01680, partial [Spirochaetota bacterium]